MQHICKCLYRQLQTVNDADLSQLFIVPETCIVQWSVSMFINCIDVRFVLQQLQHVSNMDC